MSNLLIGYKIKNRTLLGIGRIGIQGQLEFMIGSCVFFLNTFFKMAYYHHSSKNYAKFTSVIYLGIIYQI